MIDDAEKLKRTNQYVTSGTPWPAHELGYEAFVVLQSELGTKALNRINMSDFQCSIAILHT